MIKKVKIEDAIGLPLAHDLTQIIPGKFKGPRFRVGHVISPEDIDILRSMGREYIYVIELSDNEVHENDASLALAQAIIGDNLRISEPVEGKVSIFSECSGLIKINREAVKEINMLGDYVLSTVHGNIPVWSGQLIASVKLIPLIGKRKDLHEAIEIAQRFKPLIHLKPYLLKRASLIITGKEVYEGRIKDAFEPTLRKKLLNYGVDVINVGIFPDDPSRIAEAIVSFARDSDILICTGGMSVDPEDMTPTAIKRAGVNVERYGFPLLPGAMTLLGYLDKKPVIGIPAAAIYYETTAFDIILPRLLAGERVTFEDIAELGYGGLCWLCDICHFPCCPFGKA
ncbi:MAG: molybdopterin-binding protein [Synergistetes bacterium]|nr:molybdopterin-binding protein [Synergistota bacterium]